MTQHEEIVRYIQDRGSITPMDAFHDLGITKLATRVSEMRKRGREFDIKIERGKNKHGKTIKYARYSMPQGE